MLNEGGLIGSYVPRLKASPAGGAKIMRTVMAHLTR